MTFIGIGGDAPGAELGSFVEDTGTTNFTQLEDANGELWTRFGTSGRSTFMFVDDDGSYVLTSYGIVDEGRLVEEAERLIGT